MLNVSFRIVFWPMFYLQILYQAPIDHVYSRVLLLCLQPALQKHKKLLHILIPSFILFRFVIENQINKLCSQVLKSNSNPNSSHYISSLAHQAMIQAISYDKI